MAMENSSTTLPTDGASDNTWGSLLNTLLDVFDEFLGESETINSTGGTTTLTTAQHQNSRLKFTGTLASAAIVVFDGRGGKWLISNAMVIGAYTLTVKISGQAGVTIAEGETRWVFFDGTDMDTVDTGGYTAGGTDVAVADGGTGSSTAAGAATNLGLGTGDSPQFTAVNIGAATDTTLARVSAGVLSVEGNRLFAVGGTDVPVADGGTGSSTAADARAALAAATLSQTGEHIGATLAGTATNRMWVLVLKASHGGTITETTTKCVSGTGTATFKINTTALGGTANAVSSSEQSQAQASANTFAAGDDITVTFSSVSSLVDVSIGIKYTRTYL